MCRSTRSDKKAVGAAVVVTAGGRIVVQVVVAGDVDDVDEVESRLPGGGVGSIQGLHVVDGGVLEGVTVADSRVLECRDGHEVQADVGGLLAVLARAGTQVVDSGVLHGVFVAHRGVLESRDALDAVVASLDSTRGGLLVVEQKIVDR